MKIFVLAFFLLMTECVYAQYTLEAVVLDGMTRKPIINANVYLDGTTKGTTTDWQGRFMLTVNEIINTSLVISYIGYERVIIQDPFRALPKTVFLEEGVELIPEVMVKAYMENIYRKEMLEVFKKYFLGDRYASCKILNEDDLRLFINSEGELVGTAMKPLKVINNYLKYYIRFNLIEFKVTFYDSKVDLQARLNKHNTLLERKRLQRMQNPLLRAGFKHLSIIGTSLFTDIGNENKMLQKNRENEYYQSFKHFFYLLSNNKIKVNEDGEPDLKVGFQLLNKKGNHTFYDQDSLFAMSVSQDYPTMKTLIIRPEMEDRRTGAKTAYAAKIMSSKMHRVALPKVRFFTLSGTFFNTSEIRFDTDTFHIDTYGNTDLYKNFNMEGDFGIQRVGNLLPLDYMPGQSKNVSMALLGEDIPEQADERIRYYLERQSMFFPQEIIYVHTDKSHYLAGETIWFRTYLTDYNTKTPYAESSYVYGELYDPADSLIQRVKIHRDSAAVFKGYFDLHPDLVEGHYRLRFYTRYMEESGEEYFFNRTIFIGNAFTKIHPLEESYRKVASSAIQTNSTSLTSAPGYEVSFFPEGGSLPVAHDETVNLKIFQKNDSLIVETLVSGDDPEPDSMRLLIQCRGNLYRNELLPKGGKLSFDKGAFPSGVIQLLLIDGNPDPLSERLVFNLNEKDLALINLTPSKENYTKREKVELTVELTSPDDLPIQDGFSISVTSDEEIQESLNVNNDTLRRGMPRLYNAMLLTSDLKNYTESPALYFTADSLIEEIDRLLLTQSWSRYNMADILDGYIKKPQIVPEIISEISGSVSSGFLQSGRKEQYVRISAAGIDNNRLPVNITEVIDKNFDLPYNEYPNGTTYTLQIRPGSYRLNMRSLPEYPKNSLRPPYAYNMEKPETDAFRRNTAKTFEPYKEELLRFHDEVLRTGDYPFGVSHLTPGRRQDRIISRLELVKNKKLTLRQFLASVDDIAIRTDDNGTLHLRYRNGANYYDYVVIVDDRWLNAGALTLSDANFTSGDEYGLDDLLSLSVDRIKEVEIVQAPAPPIAMKDFGYLVVNDPAFYGINESLSPIHVIAPKQPADLSHPGYMGTILITTMDGKAGISDALKIAPLGYQVSREFYSPVYETKEQKEDPTPDLRTTIYWNPDVQTDEAGQAKISFYAADVPTTYTITIEGITKEGLLISKTERIVVNN